MKRERHPLLVIVLVLGLLLLGLGLYYVVKGIVHPAPLGQALLSL